MSTRILPLSRRTITKRFMLGVCLLAAMLVVAGPIQAATVQVTATGTFSTYDDPGGLLPFAEPAPGTIFTLTFSYNDQALDGAVGDPTVGLYFNAAHSAQLSFGSELFMSPWTSTVFILDDAPSPSGGPNFGDSWQNWQNVASTATTEHEIGLSLLNINASTPVTPLTSDALVQPFGPDGWDMVAAIRYRVVEKPAVGDPFVAAIAEASIDTISVEVVPVPPALWLFASALGWLGWRRKTA